MTDDAHPFEQLLAVQELDMHADQLRHRVEHHPNIREVGLLHEQSLSLERSSESIKVDHDNHFARQSEIEGEVADFDRRINEIDARLSSDASGSFRDQAAMSHEMNSLVEQKRVLEDEELEIMELLEPIDAQLDKVRRTQQHLHDRARELHSELVTQQAAVNAELREVLKRRNVLAGGIRPELVSEYEKLRTHLGGIGAARLVHGMCSGCNLALSATELDRLHHVSATELVHCEQCGRILVP